MTAQVVGADLVRDVVDQVWESLLLAPAVPWAGPVERLATATSVLTAQVALSGDWTGVVRLTCDPATAASLARAMLGAEVDEDLPADDVADAVGEVVNVVGGSVKGTLDGSTSLGLPQVGAGPGGPDLAVPAGATTRCVVTWDGEPVLLEVVPDPPG